MCPPDGAHHANVVPQWCAESKHVSSLRGPSRQAGGGTAAPARQSADMVPGGRRAHVIRGHPAAARCWALPPSYLAR
eukprot:scaffold5192_cov114-Isochrysis_galbana.AAC.2